MLSYAQNFEDVMLNRVFTDQKNGFYLDVGAADPSIRSVTKSFYDRGWNGINVEPHQEFYKKLKTARPRDINLNYGAGANHGCQVFFEFETKEWSTFDRAAYVVEKARGARVRETRVQIVPLTEILEIYCLNRTLDFIKIDVEGWEREVLLGLDLHRFRPKVIVVEGINPFSPEPTFMQWEGILAAGGYQAVYFDGLNKFFIPQELESLKSHFATPPNVFDAFTLASHIPQPKKRRSLFKKIARYAGRRAQRMSDFWWATGAVVYDTTRSKLRPVALGNPRRA